MPIADATNVTWISTCHIAPLSVKSVRPEPRFPASMKVRNSAIEEMPRHRELDLQDARIDVPEPFRLVGMAVETWHHAIVPLDGPASDPDRRQTNVVQHSRQGARRDHDPCRRSRGPVGTAADAVSRRDAGAAPLPRRQGGMAGFQEGRLLREGAEALWPGLSRQLRVPGRSPRQPLSTLAAGFALNAACLRFKESPG